MFKSKQTEKKDFVIKTFTQQTASVLFQKQLILDLLSTQAERLVMQLD